MAKAVSGVGRLATSWVPGPARRWLAHARWVAERELKWARDDARRLGRRAAVTLAAARWVAQSVPLPTRRRTLWPLRLPGYRYPVYYRQGSSDPEVIRQVFTRAEYGCVAGEPDVRFIIDCGANVGLATFYLLHKHPRARAVVVEPDPDNLRVLRRTLAPFAGRVTVVRAGVWSASAPLVVDDRAARDGAEWSIQVRPAAAGEPADFLGRTVTDLTAAGGFPRVDLLKVDIEAAEAEVFRPGCESWLASVRTLVIELHGPDCERVVAAAAARFPHTTERSGELTVFRFAGRATTPCS